jgi:D-3-phosphoglycerate dehydrogenase
MPSEAFRGTQLCGKRLGLVGLGRVGSQVAAFGQAFGMSVAAYDPHLTDWPDGVERMTSLEALLPRCDVLSLHVHLSAETAGLIGAAQLRLLPVGAVLLNTSRGGLVDEHSLVASLEAGHLAGAALDVLSDEHSDSGRRRLADHGLAQNRILITPHIGGATEESMAACELFMARKLVAFLDGLPLEAGGAL